MQISKIEQNSSPIIPQASLNGMEMYDRIKEEIKGEIEICVPAKVLSIQGYYVTVQPLPNLKTNSEKFVQRKPVTVKSFGSVSIGDVGYLISGDVSHLNKDGILIQDSTYDPMEGESHKFLNGFFISTQRDNVEKMTNGYCHKNYQGIWQFGVRGIILEDRFDSFEGSSLGGYPEDLYELREWSVYGTLPIIINNTSSILNGDTSLIERVSLREYFDYTGYLCICALFSYSNGNRLFPYTRIGIHGMVITANSAVFGHFVSNPYRTERDLKVNNTIFGKMPPFSVLLPIYVIDLYDYYKSGGDPIIKIDYSNLVPRSLPYFGKRYYQKFEPII